MLWNGVNDPAHYYLDLTDGEIEEEPPAPILPTQIAGSSFSSYIHNHAPFRQGILISEHKEPDSKYYYWNVHDESTTPLHTRMYLILTF